jgi:hypothetical protein
MIPKIFMIIRRYKMALPLIIGAAALLAGGYGVKKGVDGYNDHSEANKIVDEAKQLYKEHKDPFDYQDKRTQKELEQLGKFELEIGKSFDDFKRLADDLLKQINEKRQDKLNITFPKHKIDKIEEYSFTALGVVGSIAGAGGAAAGFAVYGGVMALGAASTGTAISSLSGIAAYNSH